MKRLMLLLAGFLLALPLCARAAPPAWDGQPNHYRVSVDAAKRRASVHADLWLNGTLLSMFNVMSVPGLEDGQAGLVSDLHIRDRAGRHVSATAKGEGDFELSQGGRLTLDYTLRLDHDRYAWPPGTEEVAYFTDEGLMITGASLFLADGGDAGITGPIWVEFKLPKDWQARTPWGAGSDAMHFEVASRRELLSNALFLGAAHYEEMELGGVKLGLVLGKRYVASRALFADLLGRQMETYKAIFGGKPRANRYLVIINEGASGDGGAFASSFSQFIAGDADARNRVIWGYVMAHELLHFWNGLSFAPADYREEWFKEGATDYLTIVTLARNGFLDENLLFKRLENVPRRYLMARMLQGLGMSVRESGKDKQPNRLLVYGGGSLAALALDVELRKRSAGRFGLPELMQRLYQRFPMPDKRYTLEDIVAIANELTGTDFAPFMARAVESGDYFDIRPSYADIGLRMDSFVEEMFISREPGASAEQQARFEAIFGRR